MIPLQDGVGVDTCPGCIVEAWGEAHPGTEEKKNIDKKSSQSNEWSIMLR